MLLLDNNDVDSLITVEDCIGAIESAYSELDRSEAAHRPRSTLHVAQSTQSRYTLATMEGVSRSAGYAALRLRSDFVTVEATTARERKYASEPGRFCGLVLLFDIATAAPVAILNDGRLQQLRVGATAALAARHLARMDARVLGVIGAGNQAWAHVQAYAAVRPIQLVRVFSTTPDRRQAFADRVQRELGIAAVAAESARAAVEEADLVALCTNATRPVVEAGWLRPGTHLSTVRHRHEVGPDLLERMDLTVVHLAAEPSTIIVGARAGGRAALPDSAAFTPTPKDVPALVDLLAGRATGRRSEQERTCFLNNVGSGLQFVAAAGLVYRRALEQGRGREIPTAWFLQDISD